MQGQPFDKRISQLKNVESSGTFAQVQTVCVTFGNGIEDG